MKRDIDTTRPHIGRIYDYILGGTQNFEVDRQVADPLLKLVPFARTWAQLNRWFLQLVASKWAEQGYERVLDLGSGLPTQGHFKEYLPNGRILFSDFDALTVEYAEELLKDQPNMRYLHTDVRQPEPLLKTAAEFFGDDRRLGIGCIGLIYFLSDEEVRRLLCALHKFSAPDSVIAISHFTPPPPGSALESAIKTYTQIVKAQFYLRTPEEMIQLISPWRLVKQAALEEWLDLQHLVTDENSLNRQFGWYGLFATH